MCTSAVPSGFTNISVVGSPSGSSAPSSVVFGRSSEPAFDRSSMLIVVSVVPVFDSVSIIVYSSSSAFCR